MQFDKIQAYMEGDDLVLLQPDLPPRPMRWVDGSLQAAPDGLIDKALAHSLYAQMACRDRLHR